MSDVDELNLSEIVRRVQLDRDTVIQHLDYFKSIGIVQEKSFGIIKIYRVTPENAEDEEIE